MLLINFVAAAQQPKKFFITSFTPSTFQLREIPFLMKLQLLTDPLLIKTKLKSFNFSFMIVQLIPPMITK